VAQYLADRFDQWVRVEELKLRVWDDESTESNAVQRVVSTLRRRLREADMAAARIEGNKGHYRMTGPK
jgi:DNA-binding winged helix-turn-helix (wHTH) protein